MKKAIGIDLGGTKIYAGLINEKGQILKKIERPTPKTKGQILKQIRQSIEDLNEEGIQAIGIGSPGTIDSVKGRVLDIGGNIEGWAHTDIRGQLSKFFPNLPIQVENDANLAGLCEGKLGAGKNLKSFIMLTLGTGLGGAIYLKKEGIYRGHNFQGAELGHVILYPQGRTCSCGQKGCAEKYISGRGIEESYYQVRGLRKKAEEILLLSQEEEEAKKVVDEFCQNLAIYLVSLKNIFDPQGIIIGGGVIHSKKYWWEQMLDHYQSQVNNPKEMEILPAKYLNDAGLIGAGLWAIA